MRRALVLVLAAATLVAAAPAAAMEPDRPSAAMRAYGLDWIQYLQARDLPSTRYAVCIVDTGVAVTPDTPPDDPNGPIVKRLSIDGGSGEPQGTTPQHLHGTRMAATAVAPRNGWGTVGMFPLGRIISVRATVDGESTFRTAGYARGIDKCLSEALRTPIAAIGLSLACDACVPSEAERLSFRARVDRAAERGIPLFAAAGNAPGPIQFPAATVGVHAVVAGGVRGRRCAYGASGDAAFALAPACPVQSAEPLSGAAEPRSDGGSSAATVEVATVLSAIRALRPEQPAGTALGWLADSRAPRPGGPAVDGRRAARASGLLPTLRRIDRETRARGSARTT